MFSLHCVDRSGAEAVRQRKENLGRELPGHSPDPLRGNDNGRKAKRYDVKIRRRVDRKRENSAILFSFQIVVQFGIDDIRDEHVARGMGDSNGRFRIFDRRLRRHAAGWTGAPWTFGILTVMSYAFLAFSGVMGRIEQTMGPQNGPAGSVMILVLNIGTLRPCAM